MSLKDGKKEYINEIVQILSNGKHIPFLTLFIYENLLFCYVEQENNAFEKEYLTKIGCCLDRWNGQTCFEMFDCYHNNKPKNWTQWKRPHGSCSTGYLAKLKPEKSAEYLFYHYQAQEEHLESVLKFHLFRHFSQIKMEAIKIKAR